MVEGAPKAADVTLTRSGGRRIELYIPFTHGGVQFDAIEIGPVKLDHVLRWEAGKFKTTLDLLGDMTGLQEATLRQLCYPDAERVFAAFLDMLPSVIRSAIDRGIVPTPGGNRHGSAWSLPAVGRQRRSALPANAGACRTGRDL